MATLVFVNVTVCLYVDLCSWWFGEVGAGGGGDVCGVVLLWRQLMEAVILPQLYFMSLQLQTQQEEKPNISMCIFDLLTFGMTQERWMWCLVCRPVKSSGSAFNARQREPSLHLYNVNK